MTLIEGIKQLPVTLTQKTEESQSLARILILVTFSFYFTASHLLVLPTAIAYGCVALAWHVWIQVQPDVKRRLYGSIIVDTAAVSALLWEAGAQELAPFLLYFWIVIDNGYRMNSRQSLCAIGASLIGFWIAILTSPGWNLYRYEVVEFTIGFTIISLFTYKVIQNLEKSIEDLAAQTDRAVVAEERASTDPLTGLGNREVATELLRQSAITHTRCGVLFLDLDNFKVFNDQHGHHVGDHILKTISKRLLNSVRHQDVVCRYAGDEFIIVVKDDDRDTIQAVAERIQTSLNKPIRMADKKGIPVTGSIGIAVLGVHAFNAADVMKKADTAMYMAKRAGRNKIAWYEEKINETI